MFLDISYHIYLMFVAMAPYMLLGLLFVGILHLFFTKELISKHIGSNKFSSILKAAIFGVPLPLCSCGVIPSSVFMSKNGASKASVVSFLISTPQTGIDSIIATYGMMGWVFAIFRPFAALIMGISGGLAVSMFGTEPKKKTMTLAQFGESAEVCGDSCCSSDKVEDEGNKFKKMLRYAFGDFLDDIAMQFLVGVIISGLISYFLPDNYFADSAWNSGILGMVILILIGIPMYVCATSSIPIALALIMKGFSPGVAFVFLAVGPATNAASLAIMLKVLGKKTVAIYLTSIIITSMLFGMLLDYIFTYFSFDIKSQLAHAHHEEMMFYELEILFTIIFALLLVRSIFKKYYAKWSKNKPEKEKGEILIIEGMSCNHCVANATSAIEEVEGVSSVSIDLNTKTATIQGDFNLEKVKAAIKKVGYEVE